ncbi:hypothetical protein [Plantactinospora sp. CA-290183]|uniref:hypothetical protein n=1 Tax=Plantactinospora sp. CA-290183 TaxID=3240006 RepID=UPI003D89F47C
MGIEQVPLLVDLYFATSTTGVPRPRFADLAAQAMLEVGRGTTWPQRHPGIRGRPYRRRRLRRGELAYAAQPATGQSPQALADRRLAPGQGDAVDAPLGAAPTSSALPRHGHHRIGWLPHAVASARCPQSTIAEHAAHHPDHPPRPGPRRIATGPPPPPC